MSKWSIFKLFLYNLNTNQLKFIALYRKYIEGELRIKLWESKESGNKGIFVQMIEEYIIFDGSIFVIN